MTLISSNEDIQYIEVNRRYDGQVMVHNHPTPGLNNSSKLSLEPGRYAIERGIYTPPQ